MDGLATRAHAVVAIGDAVLLVCHMQRGHPIHEAPSVETRPDELPGRAAERAARERFGLEVTASELIFADAERGIDHYFFLAFPTRPDKGEDITLEPEVRRIRLAAILAYEINPRGLAVSLARHR